MNQNNSDKSSNVFSLQNFREKKKVQEDLAQGREPLYISHLDGKLSGSPHLNGPKAEDFGDRLTRIRTSLEKINRLMSELKKVASKETQSTAGTPVSILSKQ